PLGRRLLFPHLSERIRLRDGTRIELGGEVDLPGKPHLSEAGHLAEFRLQGGLPVWRYEAEGLVLEKRILMPHQQNTVFITYRLLEGDSPVRLKLMPFAHHRQHDAPVTSPLPGSFRFTQMDHKYELSNGPDLPPLRLAIKAERAAFTVEQTMIPEVFYRVEENRGMDCHGPLWSPGYFRTDLSKDAPVELAASAESWEVMESLDATQAWNVERQRRKLLLANAGEAARDQFAAELVLAADQFLVTPVGRTVDATWVHAAGGEARSVIAGYPWFTDWGRDTMISLEGLTLTTGRTAEAGHVLRTFAHSIRDGLLPNLFPEGEEEGLYHTADATLWMFHALDRYVQITQDRVTLEILIPALQDILDHHFRGTQFGIGVDAADGLLRQGAPGYQLTWMDAKVEDWVVTPRRGKAVEINALWYNALRLMERWIGEFQGQAAAEPVAEHARRTRESFNRRFWYEKEGYLYDVVDAEGGADDSSCRPNQLLAVSLPNPVLESDRWAAVVTTVQDKLLTPVGLRSLAPDHPDYKPFYQGNRWARDAAYHQGTVWAWLIGPYIDAWLKTYPERRDEAHAFLGGFRHHMGEACIGSISEIFDAELPFKGRGCVAQAWSVAEVLRCWVATAPSDFQAGEIQPAAEVAGPTEAYVAVESE
ncbi:MAG: amylo-alpha-1,6-glucosidase, partial [Thermoguttaceae bacterium]